MRSLQRAYPALLVMLSLALALPDFALAEKTKLAAGDTFPLVDAQSLSGKDVRLPDDRKGRPFVAIFGFSRGAGDQIALWSHALYRAVKPSTAIYAIADLSHVPGLFRGFAVSGIRKQASPVHAEHQSSVLILSKSNPWQDLVPNGGGDDATVVSVDANGVVVYVVREPYSDAEAARIGDLASRSDAAVK